MAKKASNRSVYLRDEDWAWLQGQADSHGLSLNGIMADLVRCRRFGDGAVFPGPAMPRRAKPPAPEKIQPAAPVLRLPRAAPGSLLKKAKR